jgi:hypothetical protein
MLIVNQEVIDPALVEDAFQRIKTQAEMVSQVSCCERDDEFLLQAQDEVIDGILLAQEAERRHQHIADEIFRPAFEMALRQWRENGASWDLIESHRKEIREETLAGLRMETFTRMLFFDLVVPDDGELLAYYHLHQLDYFTPPAVHALHLVRFPDQTQMWADYSLLLNVREIVLAGVEEFSYLAKIHTQKVNQEIDLDWISMERLSHPFESILFSLREGEISPIIHHENALHLVFAHEVKRAEQKPFDALRDEISHKFMLEKKQAILRALASELRSQAVILGSAIEEPNPVEA